jgi:hypothetical protein
MSSSIDDEIDFANHKVTAASEAVSNQIALIFRLKECGLDVGSSERDLDGFCSELRNWQQYRTLLFIRRGMIESAAKAARIQPVEI